MERTIWQTLWLQQRDTSRSLSFLLVSTSTSLWQNHWSQKTREPTPTTHSGQLRGPHVPVEEVGQGSWGKEKWRTSSSDPMGTCWWGRENITRSSDFREPEDNFWAFSKALEKSEKTDYLYKNILSCLEGPGNCPPEYTAGGTGKQQAGGSQHERRFLFLVFFFGRGWILQAMPMTK